MMLVVVSVTAATVYLVEENRRTDQQRVLDAEFENQVHSFLALQEARSSTIAEQCRAAARAVRIRAALEERDIDDLYRNAMTELHGVLLPNESSTETPGAPIRASFFRFFDTKGNILSPAHLPERIVEPEQVEDALAAMGKAVADAEDQSIGFIALARGNQPKALREVVLTRIRDWNGRSLGTLAVAFPLGDLQDHTPNEPNPIRSGIWLDQRFYIDGLSGIDRQLVARATGAALSRQETNHFRLDLESGPQLVFYKALDPKTHFASAYQICLYPLAESLREEQILRWKIIAFGLVVLSGGFVASLFVAKNLSRPVEAIVAGSVKNVTLRKQAEENLEEKNRELQKALTELKATQDQVIQQERLSAIGQMASGIAHDFNNTLTPILGFSELLLENDALLSNKKEARRLLGMLRTSAKDAASVVSRLREFYRPAESDEKFPVLELADIVQQAVSLTEPKWRLQTQAAGVKVEVTTDVQASPFIAGEESALREVLTNLIFNAVDAMPHGGNICLTTAIEDEHAVVRVRDTGTGMSESVRQRCLEPFFSTKGDKGTGLGLSMVYGIVERHRGKLEIESAPGVGTTFIIRLPLADSPEQTKDGVASSVRPKKALNILVIDDEPPILEVLQAYLQTDGHTVAMASSGREALEKFRRSNFDLVVVDRVMPEMTGEQTARFLKQVKHDVPVIMLTGYGALIEVSGQQPEAVDVVMSKPVTLDALRQMIGRFLHAA